MIKYTSNNNVKPSKSQTNYFVFNKSFSLKHLVFLLTILVLIEIILNTGIKYLLEYKNMTFFTEKLQSKNKEESLRSIYKEVNTKIVCKLLDIISMIIIDLLINSIILLSLSYFLYNQHPGLFSNSCTVENKESIVSCCNLEEITKNIKPMVNLLSYVILSVGFLLYMDANELQDLKHSLYNLTNRHNIFLIVLIIVLSVLFAIFDYFISQWKSLNSQQLPLLHELQEYAVEVNIFNLQEKIIGTRIKKSFINKCKTIVERLFHLLFTYGITISATCLLMNIANLDDKQFANIVLLTKIIIKILFSLLPCFSVISYFTNYLKVAKSMKNYKQMAKINISTIDKVAINGCISNQNKETYAINKEFTPGNIYQLFGVSGIGKTSIVNAILQLPSIFKGDILINNINLKCISSNTLYKHTSLLSQKVNLIGDSYDFNLQNINVAKQLFHKVNFQYNNFKFLSGGEKQKVALFRSLEKVIEHKAKLLILDEPFSALDPLSAKKTSNLLLEICKKYNIIVILVDHTDTFSHSDIIRVPIVKQK